MQKEFVIAIPTYDGKVRVELLQCLTCTNAKILPITHCPTLVARNYAVNYARRKEYKVLVMMDSDAGPMGNVIPALVQQTKRHPCIVGVPYLIAPGLPAVELLSDDISVFDLKGIQRVKNIGTHLVAYNLKVFDYISHPYFEDKYNHEYTARTDTEDTVCHKKLYDAGIPIYCHFDYWTDHIKDKKLTKPSTNL